MRPSFISSMRSLAKGGRAQYRMKRSRLSSSAAAMRLACRDPAIVEPLFREALPERPATARMAFFRYHFTTPELRRATGAWWGREPVGATRPVVCAAAR
jgi:hypothetical protein